MSDGDTPIDRLPSGATSVGVALAAGVAGVLGSYGAAGFRPAFVVAPVSGFISKRMPGAVVTFAITVLGDLGQQLTLVTAGALVVALFAGVTWLWLRVGSAPHIRWTPVLGAAASVWFASALLTWRFVPALGAAAGVAVVVAAAEFADPLARPMAEAPGVPESDGRRRLLGALAAALASVLVGYTAGDRAETLTKDATSAPSGAVYADVDTPEMNVEDMLATAEARSLDFDDLEPLVSEEFYEVDIKAVNPAVDAGQWSLSVTGEVEEERTFSYGDLVDRETESRFNTLRCVGEALNGRKMDNAVWTGVPVGPILEAAGPTSNCNCVMLRAADGYFEEFPLDALRPGLLAFGMNVNPLPRSHGAPLRALVPGHWGEVNVKWLTEIELLEREQQGYWEKRGWHGTGPVNTVAKLHAKARAGGNRLRVGGHAYAGTRGIRTVEVSVDGGDTWTQATLSEPLPGDDVWRQWAHTYESPGTAHEVVVRARDGTGTLQPRKRQSPYPSGATGWVRETIHPSRVQ
ncbi:MAG: molybdopterin-dependent oxidoreductase [Haloarculaceae archaeon]